MKRIEQFAIRRPITFGFTFTFVFIMMLVVSAILGNLWPGDEAYGQPGGILGRAISIVVLLVILSRIGWLHSSGFTTLGGWRTWLILILPLAYSIAALTYAITGSFDFSFSGSRLISLVTLFVLTAAFLEEVLFRGLILHGFVRLWGGTNNGNIKSILVSSLFFCSIHLLDFLSGRPLSNVILQGLEAFFLGVFLGALVLTGKSIYPATFFHGILNLIAYLIFGSNGVEPATSAWLLLSILMLPLAIFGIYLLQTGHRPVTDMPMADNIKKTSY